MVIEKDEKKELWERKSSWIIVVIVLLTLLILIVQAVKVEATNYTTLNHSNCENFSFNESLNLSVDYGLINWSSYNYSGIFNYTTPTFGVCAESCNPYFEVGCVHTDVNQTLNPGEEWMSNQGLCTYNFTCLPASNGSCASVCSIDKTLGVGESYSLSEAGCDVKLRCDECSLSDCDYDIVKNVTVEYRIVREADSQVIKFLDKDNNEVTPSIPVGSAFSHSFSIDLMCPETDPLANLKGDEKWAQEVCYKYQPLMYSHLQLLEGGIDSRDEQIVRLNQELIDQSEKIQTCSYQSGKCTGETTGSITALKAEINLTKEQMLVCNSDLAKAEGGNSGTSWLLFFVFAAFLSTGAVALILQKKYNKIRNKFEGGK